MCGVFSAGTLKALLLRYTPDDFSPEAIPQSLITRLEAAESMAGARSRRSAPRPAPLLWAGATLLLRGRRSRAPSWLGQ